VPYSVVFKPGDVDECIEGLRNIHKIDISNKNVANFVFKFSREKIMNNMANHIVNLRGNK
jgi:hypothetical protein